MSQCENLKLQGSPIAERRAQGQEQRDDDGSHRRRPYPRKPARSMFSRRTELLVGTPCRRTANGYAGWVARNLDKFTLYMGRKTAIEDRLTAASSLVAPVCCRIACSRNADLQGTVGSASLQVS